MKKISVSIIYRLQWSKIAVAFFPVLAGCASVNQTQTFEPSPIATMPLVQSQSVLQSPVQTQVATVASVASNNFPVGSNVGHAGSRLITIGMRSLYTFDQDPIGATTCYGNCAQQWPPYMATANAIAGPETSFVIRRDGQRQWAVNGKPLYTYIGDKSLADQNGAGIPGWTLGQYNG